MKPFLKYVGGKSDIIEKFIGLFPKDIDTYHEPFLGGGSVLFYLLGLLENNKIKINTIRTNDNNGVLINMYINIKTQFDRYISELQQVCKNYTISPSIEYEPRHEYTINSENINDYIDRGKSYVFYFYRNLYNTTSDEFLKSVLFLFLNKTCFRGLYRESKNGFNVPFGNYKNPSFYDFEHLKNISNLLNKYKVEFHNLDYKEFIKDVKTKDFIYLDPPYYDTFTKYIKNDFNIEDQKELQTILSRLPCKFVMSNSKNEFIDDLYKNYNKNVISCKRRINSKKPQSTEEEFLVYN